MKIIGIILIIISLFLLYLGIKKDKYFYSMLSGALFSLGVILILEY